MKKCDKLPQDWHEAADRCNKIMAAWPAWKKEMLNSYELPKSKYPNFYKSIIDGHTHPSSKATKRKPKEKIIGDKEKYNDLRKCIREAIAKEKRKKNEPV